MNQLVIGIGNSFRRDDGVGLAVADRIAGLGIRDVDVLTATGEPGEILDVWADVESVVIVDAVMPDDSIAGRIRRWTPDALAGSPLTSSHAIGLAQTFALGQALGRVPRSLVLLTIDAADTTVGVGLSDPVTAAIEGAADAVLTELGQPGVEDFRPVIED